MRVISAYMLAVLGGNASPSASDIENICKAGGVDVDSSRVEALLKQVEGKSLDDILAAGREKLASVPSGGGGGGGGAAAGGAAAAAEEKVEEKVEEEESEEDMGFSLFD